ncbi:MAG: hypothetical protein LBT12_06805 [Oscillospiraceae bacterium]|jgi:ABC-2 type transport system permease protein|nr:hypothetical protein [Oscillospiraceae bacterium]
MIRTLLLLNLRAFFTGLIHRGGKKKRGAGKPLLAALVAVYVVGAMWVSLGALFQSLCAPLFESGLGWLYFALMGIIIFGLCVVSSIFTTQAQIFAARDNDLLLSMPIRPAVILLGRLAMLLTAEYLFEALIALPALVVWCVNGYATVAGAVLFVFGILLLPLLSLAVACLLAWVVALITSRMRNKNIVTLVLSLAFLAAYFWGFSNLQKYMTALIANGAELADAVRRAIFPAYFFGDAVANGHAGSMGLFALCALVPFGVMCALLSANFIRIITSNRGAKKAAYREKRLKSSNAGAALFIKELRHYLSNPMLILNMTMGSVFCLAAAVAVFVKREALLAFFGQFTAVLPGLSPAVAVCVALTFLAMMNFPSASLISLEGKTLWIARSIPVPTRSILLSKLSLHLAAGGLPVLIAAVCCAVAVGETAQDALLIIATPCLFTLTTALFGLVVNLLFPKLDWVNEIQPVKQGLPVLIVMFGGVALLIALGAVYAFALSSILTPGVFLLLCDILFALASAALYYYLTTAGARRFEQLTVED